VTQFPNKRHVPSLPQVRLRSVSVRFLIFILADKLAPALSDVIEEDGIALDLPDVTIFS
jgi:hypothetical protein